MTSNWTTGTADTVIRALRRAAEAHSDDLFIDVGGDDYTYAATVDEVARLAAVLHDLGVSAGDLVVTMLDNSADALFAILAAQWLGAIAVPINTALRGGYLRHVLTDSTAQTMLVEADLADRVAEITPDLPDLRTVVVRGAPPTSTAGSSVTWLELDALRSVHRHPGADPRPGDLACLLYTGGTTGPSKGCMISHNYLCNGGRMTLETQCRTADEANWTCLPLFHMNAFGNSTVPTILLGGQLYIDQRFSVTRFWAEVRRSGARIVNVIGSMIPLIARMPDNEDMAACHGQIRIAFGAPFAPEIGEIWKNRFGVQSVGTNIYGMTEVLPATNLPVDRAHGAPTGTGGQRNAAFDVRIFDEEHAELPDGQPGEIVLRPNRPDIMFSGYWRRPEATAASWQDGWFHTGDIGKFDADGYLYFLDRKHDYLRRSGENISSMELEAALHEHPDVSIVAAHAVPSELGEDEVKITAVLRDGATLRESELFAWAVDRIPAFALPRYIEFRDALPTSPLGKLLKYQLKDDGITPATWDRVAEGVAVVKR